MKNGQLGKSEVIGNLQLLPILSYVATELRLHATLAVRTSTYLRTASIALRQALTCSVSNLRTSL